MSDRVLFISGRCEHCKKILIGINNPVTAIAAGNILVEEGGITNFLEFLTKFQ